MSARRARSLGSGGDRDRPGAARLVAHALVAQAEAQAVRGLLALAPDRAVRLGADGAVTAAVMFVEG